MQSVQIRTGASGSYRNNVKYRGKMLRKNELERKAGCRMLHG